MLVDLQRCTIPLIIVKRHCTLFCLLGNKLKNPITNLFTEIPLINPDSPILHVTRVVPKVPDLIYRLDDGCCLKKITMVESTNLLKLKLKV